MKKPDAAVVKASRYKMNYFELFQLPESFELNLEELKARYYRLQKASHPDRFASQGEEQQRVATEATARLNEAYQALQDPVQRALHLLALRGVEVSLNETLQDPVFLEMQMDLQMMKQADPVQARQQVEVQRAALLAEIRAGFREGREESLVLAVKKLRFVEMSRFDH